MGDEGNNVLGSENNPVLELYDRQIAKDAEEYWPEARLRVCITGAGGFIASHLARRLKKEGHYIVAVDWKRNEHMTVRACTCIASAFLYHLSPLTKIKPTTWLKSSPTTTVWW